MPTCCCVVGCRSVAFRDSVSFFRIPKVTHRKEDKINKLNHTRRVKWLQAIKRDDFDEKTHKNARVCGKHFITGKPAAVTDTTHPDWVPCLNLGYQQGIHIRKAEDLKRKERLDNRKKMKLMSSSTATLSVCGSSSSIEEDYAEEQQTEELNNKGCQTTLTSAEISQIYGNSQSLNNQLYMLRQTAEKLGLNEAAFQSNDAKSKYYTGFENSAVLLVICKEIEQFLPKHHSATVTHFQQILMTMMKLRLNLDFKDLAFRFSIHPSTASSYFFTVIDVMYRRFNSLISWPDREVLRKTLPTCFRQSFHNRTTVIIDCFEVLTEKPSNLLTAAQCWSNYKHHYTIKFLIAITPQGTIAFISEAWGGRASDKHITINSKFLDNVTPNDVILADRGFLIKDHINTLQATVIVPAFTKGKTQLDPLELESTRSLANVRIHVERVIGLLRKKYRIFKDLMPISMVACGEDFIINKIVTVCAALINLQPPIVPL